MKSLLYKYFSCYSEVSYNSPCVHCFNFKCEELDLDSLKGYIAFILKRAQS